jgi:hypothetical protein
MSIYFGSTTDEELISELAHRGYEAIPVNDCSMYSFEDIEYAWNESGASFEHIGFTDFIAYLGVKRETPKEDILEIFPGTLDALNKLGRS